MVVVVTHTAVAPLAGGAKISSDEWNDSHEVSGVVESDPTGITGADAVINIVSLTQETWNAGTSIAESVITAAKLKGAIDAQSFGLDQYWTTPTRISDTVYQNLGAKPRMVAMTGTSSTATRNVQVSEDGVSWISVGFITRNSSSSASFVVPKLWRYRIEGAATVTRWAELG